MNNDLHEFFGAIQVVCAKDNALRQERMRRGECYNLLSILGISSYELKHSAIIANLLDPHGSHGCGDAFLRAFFDVLSISYPFEDGKQVTSRTEVYAGPVTDTTGGRIDILVSGKNYGLIIENKIHAKDQSSQLVRYDAHGKENFAQYNLIYLTLYGIEASEQSATTQAGDKVDYFPVSYADKGIVWLTQCARLAYDKPLVRESINQYIQTIKQLTYKDMSQENIQEVIALGVDNPEVVAILSSQRNNIAQGIREKYIFAPLRAYAESKRWTMTIDEKCDDPHIRFERGKCSILVSADHEDKKANKGWWMKLWIGVELPKEGAKQLQCLTKSTAGYPYGYEYLTVPDWYSAENFPAMKSNVATEIIEKNQTDRRGATAMLGAIIGDIVGSIYEFDNIKTKDFELFRPEMECTDDSILCIATADWLLHGGEVSRYYSRYAEQYPQPMGGYGNMFKVWSIKVSRQGIYEPYNSCGNGSAMRVAPVGWAFETEREVLSAAEVSASCTHNHPEGIKGAQATALSIYLARKGWTASDIQARIEQDFGYDLSMSVEELQARYSWQGIDGQGNGGICQDSVPQAIICALKARDFEDAVRNAISIGGDSDTIGCITGGIAEALYGIPSAIKAQAWDYLDEAQSHIVELFAHKSGISI